MRTTRGSGSMARVHPTRKAVSMASIDFKQDVSAQKYVHTPSVIHVTAPLVGAADRAAAELYMHTQSEIEMEQDVT